MVAKNNLVVNGWRWEGRKEEVYGAATGLIVAGGSRDLLGALQLCQRLSELKASWGEFVVLYRKGLPQLRLPAKHKKHNKTRTGSH